MNLCNKNSFIDKQLKIIYKFKNKAMQQLKLEERRVIRIKRDKFRIKTLEFIDIISKELNLNHTKQKDFDFLASLFAYKFLGDVIVKALNFSNLEKLTNFLSALNFEMKLSYSSLRKFSFMSYKTSIFNKMTPQITNFKHFNSYKVEKVDSMLNEIQNIIESKTKILSDLIISRHVEKLNVGSFYYSVEKKNLEPLAANLINSNFQKQNVKFISVRADIKKLCDKLRSSGFMHLLKNQASSCYKVIFLSEIQIIRYYNFIMQEILSWFSGVDNFCKVKNVVESIMRRSCLLTLKRKFKLKSIAEAINIYTKNVSIVSNNLEVVRLITKEEIIRLPNVFNINATSTAGHSKENLNWERAINKLIN